MYDLTLARGGQTHTLPTDASIPVMSGKMTMSATVEVQVLPLDSEQVLTMSDPEHDSRQADSAFHL